MCNEEIALVLHVIHSFITKLAMIESIGCFCLVKKMIQQILVMHFGNGDYPTIWEEGPVIYEAAL